MVLSRKFAAVPFAIPVAAIPVAAILVAALAGAAAFCGHAQPPVATSDPTPPPASVAGPAMDPHLVVLDPAHGGPDAGDTLGDHLFEKDVTLALAVRLRAALTAEGFTVVMTRQADSANPPTASLPTNDQRAGIANHAHALACLVVHATASGSGVHLYTSQLQPPQQDADYPPVDASAFRPVPWQSAQSGFVSQSLLLAGGLRAALVAANFPVVVGRQSVPPLDNLMCPAVAIELAPRLASDGDATTAADANYQQSVVATLATALSAWRNQVAPSSPQAPDAASDGMQTTAPATEARAAEQAAAEARAEAEASGQAAVRLAQARAAAARAAAKPATDRQGQAKQAETKQIKAAPTHASTAAGTSTAAGAHPAQAGGGK